MNPMKSLVDVIYKENFALSVQVKLTFPRVNIRAFTSGENRKMSWKRPH